MIKTILALVVLAGSSRAIALTQDQACTEVKKIKLEMSAIASNIANVYTTRVPEGGPYRVKAVTCEGEKCEVKTLPKIKKVFEPGSPDADREGYVAYPDIDVKSEMSKVIALTRDYDKAVKACP